MRILTPYRAKNILYVSDNLQSILYFQLCLVIFATQASFKITLNSNNSPLTSNKNNVLFKMCNLKM